MFAQWKMAAVLFLVGLSLHGRAEALRLPGFFGNNMVLQREINAPVWGWSEPGAAVLVRFADQEKQAVAGQDGRWKVCLDPMPADSAPKVLKIAAGDREIEFQNVVVGDVWLCGGQSNMRRTYRQYSTPAERQQDDFPLIRHFDVPINAALAPLDDVKGVWKIAASNTVGSFTGTGYFFGRKIHRETGVPIGLLHSSCGSTKIEFWMNPDSLADIPELQALRPIWQAQFDAFRADETPAEQKKRPAPFTFYYGMIHPLVPFALKGAIWYQGEANGGEDDIYYHKMRALIGGWRTLWGQGEFPFYYVQLPGYRALTDDPASSGRWEKIRLAQERALQIPHTGMSVGLDIGDLLDVHPTNKKDVGERLALWALKNDYGKKDIECSGPLFRAAKVEGEKVRLSFSHSESGLMLGRKEGTAPVEEVKDGKCPPVSVADAGGQWHWGEAALDGATLVVSLPKGAKPAIVRYGCNGMHPDNIYIYNREGLPMAPFIAKIAP